MIEMTPAERSAAAAAKKQASAGGSGGLGFGGLGKRLATRSRAEKSAMAAVETAMAVNVLFNIPSCSTFFHDICPLMMAEGAGES